MSPYALDERVISATYPLADVLLIAVAARLVFRQLFDRGLKRPVF